MKRKKLVLSMVLLVSISTPFLYVQMNKKIYEHRVLDYLLEEKGYDTGDIAEIRGEWGKLPTFYTTVIFKNEPHVTYIYYAHDEIHQAEYQIDDKILDVQSIHSGSELLNNE